MSSSYPISLQQGRLCVQATSMAIEDGLHLRIGGQVLPLQRLDDTATSTVPKQVAFLPRDVPNDAVQADSVTLARIPLDRSPATCLQIKLRRFDRVRSVPIGRAVRLPPTPRQMEFRCVLATETKDAKIELVISDENGNRLSSRLVHFDTSHRGGTHRTGYQQVRIPIAPSDTVRIATLFALVSGSPGDGIAGSNAD